MNIQKLHLAGLPHTTLLIMCLTIAVHGQSELVTGYGSKPLGIGIAFGEPNAFSVRYHTSETACINAAIGTSNLGALHLQADIQWNIQEAFQSDIVCLYAGAGGIVGIGHRGRQFLLFSDSRSRASWYSTEISGMSAGIKGILGVNFAPRNLKVEFYAECCPILALEPGFGVDIQPCFGLRYYP